MAMAQSGYAPTQTKYDEDDQKKIVKIQASIRGRKGRRDVQFKREYGGNT